ncbi:MAG TPA: PIG-L family deacetylase [Solirubrobacteraceae bacterium]
MSVRRIVVQAPRILVISPHLDDAALSLGATIAHASRLGSDVTALTVFGGDPASLAPAAGWDRACGFATAGEAARERRLEDERACALMGATPSWLELADADYAPLRSDDEAWSTLAPQLAEADLVLTPGFPLEHPDHAWLTRLLLERMPADARLALYVEQPYANLKVIGRGYSRGPLLAALRVALRTPAGRHSQQPQACDAGVQKLFPAPQWIAAASDRAAQTAKAKAIAAYSSQLDHLGGRVVGRIRLYESGWGGEGIGVRNLEALR